jgi:hypothetical protein
MIREINFLFLQPTNAPFYFIRRLKKLKVDVKTHGEHNVKSRDQIKKNEMSRVGKPEGKKPFGRSRHRREDKTKMNRKEV